VRDERAKRASRLGRTRLRWVGMKGAGALDPVRRRKHWTERLKGAKEARSEPQPVERGGDFRELEELAAVPESVAGDSRE